MKRPVPLLASIIALAFAGSAFAQTTGSTPEKGRADNKLQYEKHFKDADKNHDGGLSKDEVNAAKGLPHVKSNFDAMDTNHDGKVTLAEHDAWQKKQADAKKAAKASK